MQWSPTTFVHICALVLVQLNLSILSPVLDEHELVLQLSWNLISASNGLICDVILYAPSPFSEQAYRNSIVHAHTAQIHELHLHNISPLLRVSVQSCDTINPAVAINSTIAGKINTGSGRVLVVNVCNANSSSHSSPVVINSKLKRYYASYKSLVHLLILDQNSWDFVIQHDSTLKYLGMNHFFVGELKSESEMNAKSFVQNGSSWRSERRLDFYEFFRPTNHSALLPFFRFTLQPTDFALKYRHRYPFLSEVSRSNFQAKTLRIGAVMDETYSYDTNITEVQIQDPSETRRSHIIIEYHFHDSFAVEILHVLQSALNFTTIPIITNAWGHIGPDGKSWQGMIWYLLHDRIDLAISSTADRPFRHEVVDFNLPTSQIRLSAFFKTPKSNGGGGSSVAQPFSPIFWCVLAIWFLISGITLISFKYVISRMRCAEDATGEVVHTGHGFDGTLWSAADSFQWVLSSLCLQSYHNLPTLAPYRILIGVGYMLSIIVYAAYSGTLISFLSVVIEPIKSLEQLITARFVVNVVDSPLPLAFLSESQNEYTKKIYEKRKLEPKFSSMSQATALLNAGRFAFLVDHMNGYESLETSFTIQEACEIREIEIPYARQQQSSMVAKNSTVKRLIDYQILRMLEFGLVAYWRRKYLHSKPNCDGTNGANNFEGVNIERLGLVYRIIGAGIVFAIILLAVEVWWAARTRTRAGGRHGADNSKLIKVII